MSAMEAKNCVIATNRESSCLEGHNPASFRPSHFSLCLEARAGFVVIIEQINASAVLGPTSKKQNPNNVARQRSRS
jgi:hypothetical protein